MAGPASRFEDRAYLEREIGLLLRDGAGGYQERGEESAGHAAILSLPEQHRLYLSPEPHGQGATGRLVSLRVNSGSFCNQHVNTRLYWRPNGLTVLHERFEVGPINCHVDIAREACRD